MITLFNQKFKTAAVILAAGQGSRVGGSCPKQYQRINSIPVLQYSLQTFLNFTPLNSVLLVVDKNHRDLYQQIINHFCKFNLKIVYGGKTRQESVYAALTYLNDNPPDAVYIHDAARPFVSKSLLQKIYSFLCKGCNVVPVLKITDTLKAVDLNGEISKTIPRKNLFRAQTPQAFLYKEIWEAHTQALKQNLKDFTDDAAIAEWAKFKVWALDGTEKNFKLTQPEDFNLADYYLNLKKGT